jgi:hypothetical protein
MSSHDVLERLIGAVARLAERVRHLEVVEIVAANLPSHTHAGAGQGGTVTHAITTGQTVNDHHDKSHSHTVADGSGAIASDQNISTTKNYQGQTASINDDAATSFTPGAAAGIIVISHRNSAYSTAWGVVAYSTGQPFTTALVVSANCNVTTGVLAGTTGTDGKMTVSAHTNGKLYIENRLGVTISINILTFGA